MHKITKSISKNRLLLEHNYIKKYIMAEKTTVNQPVKSKKEAYMEAFAGRNPELDMNDEEAVYGQMTTDYENYAKSADREKRFNELMSNNEYAPGLINGLLTGENEDGTKFNLITYLAGNYPDLLQDALNGDEEALAELAKRRQAEMEESVHEQENVAALAKAQEAEDNLLDEVLVEEGMKPEEAASVVDWIWNPDNGIIVKAMRFELDKEDLKKLVRMGGYDAAISKADKEGYARGKNERIDIYKNMDDKKKRNPINLGGGGGAQVKERTQDPTLAALERMKNA